MADVVLFGIIDAQITACGFLGGMVHAFNDERATPWQTVKSILTGGVVSNFLAPQLLGVMFFMPGMFVYFFAFGIGLSGKYLAGYLELIFNAVLGKPKNE